LHLVFQPIVELGTGQAIGAEALIRWEHPQRGTIPPLEFIPIAEETGLILPIGAWVLGEACRQLGEWRDSLGTLAPRTVSVNLSRRQVANGHVADLIADLLSRHHLDPSSLCLEITESVMMEDSALRGLGELRDLGVRLSIDDFGTGYSSLVYLRRFPVQELKIDRLFVAGLGRNPEDTAIVEGVIALAHDLKLTVVAEGVETEDQAESLRHLGADTAQGYYWSRPVPFDEFAALLTVSLGAPGRPHTARLGPHAARRSSQRHRAAPTASIHRVLLIDDARSERELLGLWLEDSSRFVLVGEADDGATGIALAADLRPDLVVLDMSMPGLHGTEALTKLLAVSPHSKVVVVSGFASAGMTQAMIGRGASACLDKCIGPSRLVEQLLGAIEPSEAPVS
jgi:EAL domain-containing protein (putative c-di-GMP-specific phosphodiesterase class I)/ActR/RegA family two-component response regulator